MATYNFSALSNGQAISFNPGSDVLNFDQTAISAGNLQVALQGSDTHITVLSGTDAGKSITLLATMPPQLATSNVQFANGSALLFGDNSASTSGDDLGNLIRGTNGADLSNGFGGNDTIAAGEGNDSVLGGAGNDTIYGDGGKDWIEGGAGNDFLDGSGDQDSIVFREFGAANADTVSGFASDWDNIQLDAAAFTAIGTSGRFAANDVRFYAAPGATGGHDADDRIIYNTTTGQLFYDADGNGPGAAQLIATLDGARPLIATDINVFGTPTPPPPPGPINGTARNDSLVGTPNNDTINGFDGNDTIDGAAGNDQIKGGAGDDVITGGDGNDFISGNEGNDTLSGGGGDDVFSMANTDSFTRATPGNDVIDGGAGIDLVGFSAVDVFSPRPVTVDLAASTYRSATFSGTIVNVENVIGSNGPDLINGNAAANSFFSGGGDDTMTGADGNDTLTGLWGNDWLNGGAGNDVLTGNEDPSSRPNDTDNFVFDVTPGGANADVIVDFQTGYRS